MERGIRPISSSLFTVYLREGKGTLYFEEDETSLSGTWENGEMQGLGVYIHEDGGTTGLFLFMVEFLMFCHN